MLPEDRNKTDKPQEVTKGRKPRRKTIVSNENEANSLELYYLTKAYNRGEINFNDWLEESYQWALKILQEKNES